MRFEGMRKSKVDSQVQVYLFACNKEELKLIWGMSETALKYLPATFDKIPMRGRLRSMKKTTEKILKAN